VCNVDAFALVEESKAIIAGRDSSGDILMNERRIHDKAFCEESYGAVVVCEPDEADAAVLPAAAHLREIQAEKPFCLAAS
jgi:hypothetical protein